MNRVIYDWLTFTTKIHDLDSVMVMLGLCDVTFKQYSGRYGYADRLSFEGVNILYNGRDDMGICVEMSGKGCRTFETYGNGDYDKLFSEILLNIGCKDMNITRLDVAYDDFEGVLDLYYLMQAAQRGDYVSRLHDIEVVFSNKGCSVNHGNRYDSNVFIRIYDKKMEQKREDIEHWIRCEMKLKDCCAKGFLKLGGDIRKNYFDVLNNYLHYVVPSVDKNKSQLPMSPEWLRFIEGWESVSIFDKPGKDYNIMNLDGYVRDQLSGALTTYIDSVGVPRFLANILEAREGKPLNPRYTAIKSEVETSENNCKAILDYLREHGKL